MMHFIEGWSTWCMKSHMFIIAQSICQIMIYQWKNMIKPSQFYKTNPPNPDGHCCCGEIPWTKLLNLRSQTKSQNLMKNPMKNIIWLVVWLPFLAFSQKYWVANHPNWRTHIFQRGGPTTNQSWKTHHFFLGEFPSVFIPRTPHLPIETAHLQATGDLSGAYPACRTITQTTTRSWGDGGDGELALGLLGAKKRDCIGKYPKIEIRTLRFYGMSIGMSAIALLKNRCRELNGDFTKSIPGSLDLATINVRNLL